MYIQCYFINEQGQLHLVYLVTGNDNIKSQNRLEAIALIFSESI